MLFDRTVSALLRLALVGLSLIGAGLGWKEANAAVPAGTVRVHYNRPDANYSGWAVYSWNASTENASWCSSEVAQTGSDSFGAYYDITVNTGQGSPAGDLGFIINNCAAGQIKDPGPDQHLQTTQFNEAWVVSGVSIVYTSLVDPKNLPVRIHYYRPDGNYSGWAVYSWNASTENASWCSNEVPQTGSDSYGAYYDVTVNPTQGSPAGDLGFIINNCGAGQIKDPGPDQHLQITQYGAAWVVSTVSQVFTAPPNPTSIPVRIHYHRPDGNYSGWALYTFGATTVSGSYCGSAEIPFDGTDNFGVYFDVSVNPFSGSPTGDLGFIVNNCGQGAKDPGKDQHLQITQFGEAWVLSGDATVYTSVPSFAPTKSVRIHYYRPDGNYSGWAMYTFNASAQLGGYCGSGEIAQAGSDAFGVYFDVQVYQTTGTPVGDLGFIINNCAQNIKDPGPDQHLQTTVNAEAWVIHGNPTVFTTLPTAQQISNSILGVAQAYWMDRSRVAIQSQYAQSGDSYALSTSLTGGLTVTAAGVTGGTTIPLTAGGTLTQDELTRFPQLASYTVLQVPATVPLATIRKAVQGELAFSAVSATGKLQYATGVQDFGVLDDLYYYGGKLGVVFKRAERDDWRDWDDDNGAEVKLKVWAPTAQTVSLLLFNNASDTTPASTIAMHQHNGVWVAPGNRSWKNKYYLYSVKVWVQSDGQVDTNVTSDPYSIDIALNGAKSRITDLDSEETKPEAWDWTPSPDLRSLSDLSLYELHIRDFSINDSTVPAQHRGMYEAFNDLQSNGMQHLRALAASGLKAVHILPSFHFASVNEDKTTWQTTGDLSQDGAASEAQQAAVTAIQGSDGYNWGYDPVHYMTPEGSYAINPDNRVKEYRTMVRGLHRAGLRVVQDVVFNHTNASGEGPNSNLDEVVPGYYHRLDANGLLETGSCCADTASEHRMMEKLITDTLVLNATEYKVDGFRFDIMAFHFTYNMQHFQQALSALRPERDGVDGSKIYIYGEGFNFGDTVNSQIGPNASQLNLYGFGIGTFNDRIRDGIRGGSPFTDERVQGFATGLLTDSSAFTNQSLSATQQRAQLLQDSDWVLVGLSGNLRDYSFVSSSGATVTGAQVDYNGQPTGYAATPIEAVNYASVHDNQDLFDAVQLKSNLSDSIATRARRQVMAMSLLTLGQGVPFFHGGDDLLRSKDMDQNSYDSGDWFNKIDWSGQTSNWGIGLPMASQNSAQWPLMTPLLSDPTYTPLPANISYSGRAFQELLQIRGSSDLFHMGSFQEVQRNLKFLNTGPNQTAGLIVMKLDANGERYEGYPNVLVVFNASNAAVTFSDASLRGLRLSLHPVQRGSADAATRQSSFNSAAGSVTVPALTTAVFASGQGGR